MPVCGMGRMVVGNHTAALPEPHKHTPLRRGAIHSTIKIACSVKSVTGTFAYCLFFLSAYRTTTHLGVEYLGWSCSGWQDVHLQQGLLFDKRTCIGKVVRGIWLTTGLCEETPSSLGHRDGKTRGSF